LRRLIALTLAVVACRGDRQASEGAHAATSSRGPDAVALRIPRAGGIAHAYLFPHLDSSVWSAGGAPPPGRVLGFDPDAGLVALTDDKGQPRRIDLRLGEVRTATKSKLAGVASVNGSDIYGIVAPGNVIRLTPSGDWTFKPPVAAQSVFPQVDGSVVIAGAVGTSTRLWKLQPPDEEILDTATLADVSRGPRAQAGDRIYFASKNGLAGVRTRDLSPLKAIRLRGDARAMVATPSGDRVYVALAESPKIAVVDRYSESVAATIDLPGAATDLRVDPMGRFVIAKPEAIRDSAWVIAIGTGRVTGSVATAWTSDLPAFGPLSTVATLRGNDIVFVDATTLAATATVRSGAKDFWYFFYWNGFRPRSAGLDQPVTFGSGDSVNASDSTNPKPADSLHPAPPMRDASPTMLPPPATYPGAAPPAPAPPAAPRSSAGYLVSFAAVLNDKSAQQIAAGIQIEGARAHVVQTQSGGTTIFRVVLGPYATRDEADRIGRESGRQYWVYEAGT
jgi:cell division septation protein DedD